MAVDQQYIQAAAAAPAPAVPSEPIFRLTVDQYHQMIATGVLTDEDRVELLEGWLIAKPHKTPQHSTATHLTREAIAKSLPSGWHVDTHCSVTMSDSEPEPDLAVICGEVRQYVNRHPWPSDVALVIEIADITLKRDRNLKKHLYARAGIQCYWIMNLIEQQIEVYSQPVGQATQFNYQRRQDYLLEQKVPLGLNGNMIGPLTVCDLLP